MSLVLVVDDDELVRSIAREFLELAGHTVLLAADGREALELVAGAGDGLDAILMDSRMPRLTGEATVAELRARGLDIPVVLTSGYAERADETRFARDGIVFLPKPYSSAELAGALELAMARRPLEAHA